MSTDVLSPTMPVPAAAASPRPVHTIGAARHWYVPVDLAELWSYRELLYFLVWRDVKVRYKQTALGLAWAVIQPVLAMVVFTVVFGKLGKLPSDGVPYPVFTYCALLPWQLFAFALAESSNSVVANQRLVTKVYFPRLILPIAATAVGLADFVVASLVLAVMMAYYGVRPEWTMLTLPLWALFAVLTALSAGFWLAALNARYRDIRYTLGFLTQIWLFATPVAYSMSIVPPRWRALYAVNPMVGVVEGFRWATLGTGQLPVVPLIVSAGAVAVLFAGGLHYFRRTERTFADVV